MEAASTTVIPRLNVGEFLRKPLITAETGEGITELEGLTPIERRAVSATARKAHEGWKRIFVSEWLKPDEGATIRGKDLGPGATPVDWKPLDLKRTRDQRVFRRLKDKQALFKVREILDGTNVNIVAVSIRDVDFKTLQGNIRSAAKAYKEVEAAIARGESLTQEVIDGIAAKIHNLWANGDTERVEDHVAFGRLSQFEQDKDRIFVLEAIRQFK